MGEHDDPRVVLTGEAAWSLTVGEVPGALDALPDASADACVCDPPYEIGFMGRGWDRSGVAFRPETWAAVHRVLKPGGYLLAFGATRSHHRMTCAIEDADFEIRDCIHWVFGTGFAKSRDLAKVISARALTGGETAQHARRAAMGEEYAPKGFSGNRDGFASMHARETSDVPMVPEAEPWQGWGSALKPAYEPIVVGRKPLDGTLAQNVLAHGTGGLNLAACEVPGAPGRPSMRADAPRGRSGTGLMPGLAANNGATYTARVDSGEITGRVPANLLLGCCGERPHAPECPVPLLNAQSGYTRSGIEKPGAVRGTGGIWSPSSGAPAGPQHGDAGGAARFFPTFIYCAKAPGTERRVEGAELQHPTQKPLELMRWLCRLVAPRGAVVLDPFAGSGTTGVAARAEGLRFVGFELLDAHAVIARARLAEHAPPGEAATPERAAAAKQTSLFPLLEKKV